MMNIYKIIESDKYGIYEAFFTDKEQAEKYVRENNKPWTNKNGITFNTVTMEEIKVGKFYTKG